MGWYRILRLDLFIKLIYKTRSSSKQTHDHATIKAWVEKHDGVPAIVADTAKTKSEGILRIHFPKHSNSSSDLKETDWDSFFKTFDDHKLDFLYQDKKAD